MLVAVVADCIGRATCNAHFTGRNLRRCCRLAIDIRKATSVMAADVVWCVVAAKAAIGALVGDVILAGNVLRIAIGENGHDRTYDVRVAASEREQDERRRPGVRAENMEEILVTLRLETRRVANRATSRGRRPVRGSAIVLGHATPRNICHRRYILESDLSQQSLRDDCSE